MDTNAQKRPRRTAGRLVVLAFAAVALAAAFLIEAPPQGRTQTPGPINLTGAVETANCVPCHVNIADASRPGLLFSHGNHLMVACSACHLSFPHEGGKTATPGMDMCFTCHGVAHGSTGELASRECSACHTKSFELRPKDHVKDWAKKPHAASGKAGGVNRCMTCHDAPKDCDVCHAKEGLKIGKMPAIYQSIIPDAPRQDPVRVYPTGGTTMGQCAWCHPNLDDFKKDRVIFGHGDHLERGFECRACHAEFAHDVERIRRPDMLSCYRCHGLTHAANGEVATEKCTACHPKTFELMPPDHTKGFRAGTHKKQANAQGEYCAMCHQPKFCTDCHRGGRKLATGVINKAVIPQDHRKADWQSKHGQLFLEQKGACGSCHDSTYCATRCHKTPMPHPSDWLGNHGKLTPDDPDCNVCHIDRNRCQQCHHDKVKREELVAGNCVPCHDEMKQKPATGIKNKGFAEHAVHFDVGKEEGRKPYRCYECHVDFGSSSQSRNVDLQMGHDLRLCYGCHGRLDYRNRLIAPYQGSALCLRCHPQLNI